MSFDVWNRMVSVITNISDLGSDGWKNMVFVENAKTFESCITEKKCEPYAFRRLFNGLLGSRMFIKICS